MSNEVGDVKKLRLFDLVDDEGVAADPKSLVLTVRAPNGTQTEYTYDASLTEDPRIIRVTIGTYYFRLLFTEDGAWEYRWKWAEGAEGREGGTIYCGVEPLDDPFPDDIFTVAEVWARSNMLRDRYPSGSSNSDLSLLIATAAPLVGSLTGRTIAGTTGEAVPTGLLEIARRAIAMKAEQLDTAVGSAESREDAIERSRLRSISAGSWSESYWGPGEAAKGKTLDADPLLAEILWQLCTEEKKAEWLALWDPENVPGASVIEAFDYGQRPGWGGY